MHFIDGIRNTFSAREQDDLSMFDIIFRSFDAMQNTISRLKLAAYDPDVIIELPRDVCATHEYWRAAELIEFGRVRTEAAREKLAQMARR